MTRLPSADTLKMKIQMSGHSYGNIAKNLGVSRFAVANFVAGRLERCGAAAVKKIRRFLIELEMLPAPKLRPRCVCPTCGKIHAQRKGVFPNAGIPNVVRVDAQAERTEMHTNNLGGSE